MFSNDNNDDKYTRVFNIRIIVSRLFSSLAQKSNPKHNITYLHTHRDHKT